MTDVACIISKEKPETIRECVRILDELFARRRLVIAEGRRWKNEFKPLWALGLMVRQLREPAMTILLREDFVQYYATTSNDAIPDESIRLHPSRRDAAEEFIQCYLKSLKNTKPERKLLR